MRIFKTSIVLILVQFSLLSSAQTSWQPVPNKMMTQWGEKVTPQNAWREYPRPQLIRSNWQNLNGLWDYAIVAKDTVQPTQWQGKILVPYVVESTLSGVGKLLEPTQALWYHRTIKANPTVGKKTLLNFEAVDYNCSIWINNKFIGSHTGGSTAFSFDITNEIVKGNNELIIKVIDATTGTQLRGKQTLTPKGGIYYTRSSGICQTVWLEEVPELYISDIKILTSIKPATISITPHLEGKNIDNKIRISAYYGKQKVATTEGVGELKLVMKDAKLWSPEQPNIYDLKIELLDAKGKVIEEVKSYTGLREVGKKRDAQGNMRFTLNGEEIFHWGPLDQGWWPDGLLTPPSETAMRFDIDFLKKSGFNMIRKHIKVEPRSYYEYCDRVGMLVWQDQVLGGKGPKWTKLLPDPIDADWNDNDHEQYMFEFKEMIDQLHNYPCIVVWTPFNEAWSQHRTMKVGEWVKKYDSTRLINIASGGNFWPVGDIADCHAYPHPSFPLDDNRFKDYIKVVGEFGGHGFPTQNHLWDPNKKYWGYGGLPKYKAEYEARFKTSFDILVGLKLKGISGGVYTQTTDVEGEINGLMTYDRKVIKITSESISEMNKELGIEIKR